MTPHRRFALFAAWILSLSIAGASGAAYGQNNDAKEGVLSGGDIGFRVEGKTGDVIIGDLLVRVDGEWKEVTFSPKMTRAR
jgi:hypothetical protein